MEQESLACHLETCLGRQNHGFRSRSSFLLSLRNPFLACVWSLHGHGKFGLDRLVLRRHVIRTDEIDCEQHAQRQGGFGPQSINHPWMSGGKDVGGSDRSSNWREFDGEETSYS